MTDDTRTPDPLYLALRSARGMRTLRSVAAAVGIDFTYLSKIENGHDRPSRDLVVRLDDTYGAGGSLVRAFDDEPCPRCGRLAARPAADTVYETYVANDGEVSIRARPAPDTGLREARNQGYREGRLSVWLEIQEAANDGVKLARRIAKEPDHAD